MIRAARPIGLLIAVCILSLSFALGKTSATAQTVTVTPTASGNSLIIGSGPIPTNTSAPTETSTPTATPTLSPTATLTVTAGSTFIATDVPAAQVTDSLDVTPASVTYAPVEHFLLTRPISADGVNYPAYNYTYGGTENNNRPIHHGDDFENPYGTPILAAGDGVVEYAGDDIHKVFGPQPNFYGNVIVIRHPFTDSDNQPVFSLYGHLSQIMVHTGEVVTTGRVIGLVGSAGVAIGAHLHFEVRVGDPTNYNATRNPGLWVIPFPQSGAVAGRVTDPSGSPVADIVVRVQNQNFYRETETYADSTTPGDTAYHENFAISDIPAGQYLIFIRDRLTNELLYKGLSFISPNQVTWLGNMYIQPQPTPAVTP